jgi:hypothetical protein
MYQENDGTTEVTIRSDYRINYLESAYAELTGIAVENVVQRSVPKVVRSRV